MKNITLIFLLILMFKVQSQNTAKDFFKVKSMVWYGLNFSKAKMVGSFDQIVGTGSAGATELRNKWIPAWNSLIIDEPNSFKLNKAFRKDEVYYDLKANEIMNQEIDLNNLMTRNSYHFSDPQKATQDVVTKLLAGDNHEGLGVVYVVEYFDKGLNQASVFVTIFDIKTKKVLITERITGQAAGFGLRNFWAGAIKDINKRIIRVKYNSWRSNEN